MKGLVIVWTGKTIILLCLLGILTLFVLVLFLIEGIKQIFKK